MKNEPNVPFEQIVIKKGSVSPDQILPGKLFFIEEDTIPGWQRKIHEWAGRKGWNQSLEERGFGDWMQLFVTEISEAYEDYRNHHKVDEIYWEDEQGIQSGPNKPEFAENPKPCGIPIEIADLTIRVLHFCEHYGINLNEMIALKMKYNETRSHRHGNKKV